MAIDPITGVAAPVDIVTGAKGLTSGPTGSALSVPANVFERESPTSGGLAAFPGLGSSEAFSKSYAGLVTKMSDVAQEQLKGVVPKDVQDQIRIMSAENSLKYGLGQGSQASRNIVARDLGLTSLDIQKQGQAAAESTAKLLEQSRQFNASYLLDVKKHMEDIRKTDLTAAQQIEESRRFNAEQKIKAAQVSATLLGEYHRIGYEYAANNKANAASAKVMSDDINALLADLYSIRTKLV